MAKQTFEYPDIDFITWVEMGYPDGLGTTYPKLKAILKDTEAYSLTNSA